MIDDSKISECEFPEFTKKSASASPAPTPTKGWALWHEEGPIRPGHKTGHPATYSICVDDPESGEHSCIAMTFGATEDEAFSRAEAIVNAVNRPAPDLEAIARKHFPVEYGVNGTLGDMSVNAEHDLNNAAREACLSALKDLLEAMK